MWKEIWKLGHLVKEKLDGSAILTSNRLYPIIAAKLQVPIELKTVTLYTHPRQSQGF